MARNHSCTKQSVGEQGSGVVIRLAVVRARRTHNPAQNWAGRRGIPKHGHGRDVWIAGRRSGFGWWRTVKTEVTEVAAALRVREQRILGGGLRLAEARSLIRKEEEGVILNDRAAEGSAELILVEDCCLVREEVRRIHERVAIEVERTAVEVVRPRLDDCVHDRARVPSVLRINGVGHHIEFSNGIRARND